MIRISILLVLLCACSGQARITATPGIVTSPSLPTAVAQSLPTPSATPTVPATSTATPTPLPTPTWTPTPTPTALPLTMSGNPRALSLSQPVPQANAPCGLVDIFDFPMSPPDANNISAGDDFGVFRDRYDKYHAGEDWWGPIRGQTLGQPVYSIGHGLVTYAEPEGWNRDKGVIIIQHTFANGRILLSFYGHLDPPSFLVQAGDCVERGEQIAQVGKPRTSPHLHFEIRTQSPYAPLSGYWPEDPTLVGWLPPSQTIWEQRIVSSPGVQWIRPFHTFGTKALGMVNDTFVILENSQLVGLNVADGRVVWRYSHADGVSAALLDAQNPIIYLANQAGEVEAISLLTGEGAIPTFGTVWQVKLAAVGIPALLPQAKGGLVFSVRRGLFGLSADGVLQWQQERIGQPASWVLTENQLILSTTSDSSPLWLIDENGAEAWEIGMNGRLTITDDQVWLMSRNGLYRLNLGTRTAELHYLLPSGMLSLGDMVALPDGSLLLAHADPFDRRLMLFDGGVALRWERSYDGLLEGQVHLFAIDDKVYLVSLDSGNSGSQLSVFVVDMEGDRLVHLFSGGTRSSIPTDTWIRSINHQLLINIGGGHLFALDPQRAYTLVLQTP